MSEFSKSQLAAWDEEYFDHLDSLMFALLDRQWEETKAGQRALRCMTERDGWWCTAMKHEGERHVFRRENQFAAISGEVGE
jgi:hypothetical protein